MQTEKEQKISDTLGMGKAHGHRRRIGWLVGGVLLAIVLVLLWAWLVGAENGGVRYITQPAGRGDLTVTVTATGTLEPTNEVEVGSELSGIIDSVAVDYNDHVKVGQVLARLDTSKLKAQVQQSQAAVASARARVLQARATVHESTLQFDRLKRMRRLSDNGLPSQQELDTAEATLERAKADLAMAEAAVAQAQATLESNETDLGKAVIRSPINGIVLSRNVEPGQTVAASLQAPVLFTLAEDLTHMELSVDVDEADVGQVKSGQEASFTVDAYPKRTFPARITQVRYGAKTVEGVVTYETILNVDNRDLSLRPGMTATADIVVRRIKDALLVPSAALRFAPPQKTEAQPPPGGFLNTLLRRRPHTRPQKGTESASQQRVWTLRNGQLIPIPVDTGASEGGRTQLLGGNVKPGMALVVDTAGSPS